MKKSVSLLLALVLAFAMVSTAFAVDNTVNTQSSSKDVNVTVTYDYSENYIVTIPANFGIGPTEGQVTVSASEVRLSLGKELNVKVASTNNWYLKIGSAENPKIAYVLSQSSNGTCIANNTAVLTVPAGIEGGAKSETLYHKASTAAIYAGTYTDTLTFTVSVDNAT